MRIDVSGLGDLIALLEERGMMREKKELTMSLNDIEHLASGRQKLRPNPATNRQ